MNTPSQEINTVDVALLKQQKLRLLELMAIHEPASGLGNTPPTLLEGVMSLLDYIQEALEEIGFITLVIPEEP